MSMRISSLALLAGLAACAPQSDVPEGEYVDCAVGKGAAFSSDCILERLDDGLFAIHHPDGSFYRFRYDVGAANVVVADGAYAVEEVVLERSEADTVIEFNAQESRYRIDLELIAPPVDERE